MHQARRTVLILLFPDVEVLDFCGPFEAFNAANEVVAPPPFDVRTVARTVDPLHTRGGLHVTPHHDLRTAPPADVLILPGGHGTHAEVMHANTMQWIGVQQSRAELILSVCTGARFLAALGLLDGRRATTHHTAFASVAAMGRDITMVEGVRFIDEGRIITAAGVSAGIDASLHAIGRLCSQNAAAQTARYMEWAPGT